MRRISRPLALLVLLALATPSWGAQIERFIVVYDEAVTAKSAAVSSGGAVRRELPEINALAIEMTPDEARSLAGLPGVVYVEPDPPRYLQAQSIPYGIDLVEASSVAPGPEPVTACVIDTGYDLGHPDLPKGAQVDGFGDDWNEDPCGHGSHVAGTLAARDNKRGVVGTAPGVSLYIVRVFEGCDSRIHASDLIAAAFRCREAGARVINMSLACSGRGCRSNIEAAAFDELYDAGILSVAAAGNDGSKKQAYPASYGSVVSVGALNSAREHAGFSQRNKKVELSAPGVGVLSTITRRSGYNLQIKVGNETFDGIPMLGSPRKTGRGPLVDCGIGDAPCPGGGDQICLIERGEISFADKVVACESGGGKGAIIYNNVAGHILGTLGDTETSIPSVGITRVDGLGLLEDLGRPASVRIKGSGHYAHLSGTSMATPHVAGVAALLLTHNDGWTPDELRDALGASARDLGPNGRDRMYGFGMVQAAGALDALLNGAP